MSAPVTDPAWLGAAKSLASGARVVALVWRFPGEPLLLAAEQLLLIAIRCPLS